MRKKHTRFTSPPGIAKWPHLNRPDKKFHKEDGVYHTQLILSHSDSQEMKSVIDKVISTNVEDLKQRGQYRNIDQPPPYYNEVDDEGNETGNLCFKMKLKAVGVNGDDRWEQRPKIVDASTHPWPADGDEIGRGSRIRCGFEIVPYCSPQGAGVTLRLKTVQVIDLKDRDGDAASEWGFDEVEGYTVGKEETKVTTDFDETDF
jgi:hypothetical protein